MDTNTNKPSELQVGPRLKGLTLERLNELVTSTGETANAICKKLLDAAFSPENDPAAILAGAKVIPPIVGIPPVEEKPTVDLSGLATSAQVETIGTTLQALVEKPVDLAPVLNKIDGIEVKPVVNLNPLLDEIRTVNAKIEELPKFEKTDLKPLIEEFEALRNKLGALPAVFEAVPKIKTDLGKVAAGLDVLNKNVGSLADRKEADLSGLATTAQVEALTAAVTVLANRPAPTPEPPWRRIGIPVAIGVCLLFSGIGLTFSAIAAYRQVPAPVTPTSVDLSGVATSAQIEALRQLVEKQRTLTLEEAKTISEFPETTMYIANAIGAGIFPKPEEAEALRKKMMTHERP